MEDLKEIQQIKKRFLDLANKSYRQNMYTFTDFIGEGVRGLLYEMRKELSFIGYKEFGGSEDSERVMVRFGNADELGYEEEFPISIIKISPLLAKFSDELTHRDYLGSLMNLGIERDTMGDILMSGKDAYLFCEESIAPYIMENLSKIKHTSIVLKMVDSVADIPAKEPEEKEVLVTSLRVDGIISRVYNKSRSQSIELFRERKVYVNGRVFENNSGVLKNGDMVSVRGFGRFRYVKIIRETSKGKYNILLNIYR